MTPNQKQQYVILHEKYGDIKIKCKGSDSLPIDAIMDFQGGLKKRSVTNKIKLATQIFKNGFIAPFFVWDNKGDYMCMDGHGRSDVLCEIREAGIPIPGLFPVAYIEADNEQDAKAKLLAITSSYGDFDLGELTEWMNSFESDIQESFRFLEDEIKINLQKDETISDDEFEEKVKTVTKPGDLWELGNHRLLCGDSTNQEDCLKLMNGKLADLYLSDPPYNVDYTGKTKDALMIKNDKKSDSDFREFLKIVFENIFNILKPGACFYIWHAALEGHNFRGAIHDMGEKVRQCLIWNKNTMVIGRQDFQWKHEPCLYGWKEGAAHLWASDRKQTTVLNFDRPAKSTEHPTMKPVALFEYQIQNNTKGQDLVVDNFIGSGTTIIAAEKTNRICYGLELDPHYCDVIVSRYTKWCEENNKQYEIRLNGEIYQG